MSKLCRCRCGVNSWRPSCSLDNQRASHVPIREYHKLTVTLSGATPERTRSPSLGPACVMHKATDTHAFFLMMRFQMPILALREGQVVKQKPAIPSLNPVVVRCRAWGGGLCRFSAIRNAFPLWAYRYNNYFQVDGSFKIIPHTSLQD